MVYITHVRFDGAGTSPEHIVMLRWRQAMGDTNIADMIRWIDGGGIAKVSAGSCEEDVKVVRPPGKEPYLQTIANGLPTSRFAELPRF